MRGRTDRIALIHAVYGTAWAGLAFSVAPPWPSALLVAAGVVLTAIAARRIGKTPARPSIDENGPDEGIGRSIVRINIATGVAIVVAIVGLHLLRADRLLVAAVLLVMALHFLPLWRLLQRRSLIVMALMLGLAAALALSPDRLALAIALAAMTFLVNAAHTLPLTTSNHAC